MTSSSKRKKVEDPANLKELLLAKLSGGLKGLAPHYEEGDGLKFEVLVTQVLEQKFPKLEDETAYLLELIEGTLIYPVFYPPSIPEDAGVTEQLAQRRYRMDMTQLLLQVRESRQDLKWSSLDSELMKGSDVDDLSN